MAIEIVSARPQDDANQVADLIWTVYVPLMEYIFGAGERWRRLLAVDWPHLDGIMCHAGADLAIEDGRILGVIVSHDTALFDDRFASTLKRWREAESPDMAAHLDQALSRTQLLFPHSPDDSYYVFDLAVDARARNAGIGRRLMQVAEARARALGRSSLHLDMNADNPAVGFYRRFGMEVEIETRLPALERDHGLGLHQHWVKALT